MSPAGLPSLVQRFFTQRLLEQQGLSSHTVASYRDTFRLLLAFATKHIGRVPSKLRIEDFDVSLIEAFLQHLEHSRGNSVRTRNTRLAALHAFFRFVAVSEPALFLQCQRILAIPSKRCEHGPVEFLTESEAAALVRAPDVRTWIGNRDRTLLLVAVQTGLRNSELTALRRQDVMLGTGAHVRCLGKGRKTRCTPLRPDVVAVLKQWLLYQSGEPGDPVFPSSRGGHLSADALQRTAAPGRLAPDGRARRSHPARTSCKWHNTTRSSHLRHHRAVLHALPFLLGFDPPHTDIGQSKNV